jgi:hypothetical protein
MAGIPAGFAGDRNLLADPQTANTAAALGDIAAVNLQVLHHLQATLTAAGVNAAEVDRLRVGLSNAMQAANTFAARESSTRELRPMCQIPNAWGAVGNLANVRLNQLPQFEGDSKDTREIVRWLNRMVAAAEAHNLTEQATKTLMVHLSKGSCSDLIHRLAGEGKTFVQIARCLELRYGDLCSSEEAVVKVNTMPRFSGESFATFLDRMRHIAEMAKRDMEEGAAKQAAIESLIEANIRRVLPTSVKDALEERLTTRRKMGQPQLSLMEIEKEVIELERRRDERHLKRKAKSSVGRIRAIQAAHQQFGYAPQMYEQPGAQSYSSYDSAYAGSSSDSEDERDVNVGIYAAPEMQAEDPGMVALVHSVNYISSKYQARGINPNPEKVFQKAVNRYNRNPQQALARAQGYNAGAQRPYQGQQGYQGHQGHGRPRQQDRPQARQVTAQAYPMPPQQVAGGMMRQQGGIYMAPEQVPQQHQRPLGPPNRLPDGRFLIRDLMVKGNCSSGECIKCGRAGHIMTHDACPLRGKPLQDRACLKCKKGLHATDDCLMAFQTLPQQGQVNQINAEWTDDSDLNE